LKKIGDRAKVAPRSFGQLLQTYARELSVPDERFNRFYEYEPIPLLMQDGGFFRDKRRIKAICGANKASKTWAGVIEAVMVYTGIVPRALRGVYPHKIPTRPRHVRIIVQDYSKHWAETIRPILTGADYGMLPEAWSDYNEQEHMFVGPDGSYLSIVAIDPTEKTDPNILRGPQIDHTMIDEINTEVAFAESFARSASLKSGPRTLTLTYCPQNGYACWTYDRIYAAAYDKLSKRKLPLEKQHPDIFCQVVKMRDNPSITEETIRSYVATFRDWEIPYRVDGEYSQRASNPYFHMDTLLKWEKENRCFEGVPVRVVEGKIDVDLGKFESKIELAKANRDEDAIWRMWDEPTEKHKYACLVDPAEGNKDSDFSVCDIWDLTDRSDVFQVAQLRTRALKPGAFAVQCGCMATQFGALIVPETNNTAGGIVIDRLRNYQNLYRRISAGRVSEEESERLGFHTGPMNKGTILEDLYKLLQRHAQNNKCPIRSKDTLLEMLAYEEQIQRDKFGVSRCVWAARLGAHDDTVMTAALAARICVHEYSKLGTCVLSRKLIQEPLTKMEKEAKADSSTTGGAYQNMKKKPNLMDLRKKYTTTDDPNRRNFHG